MLSETCFLELIFCVIQEKPNDPDVFRLLGEVRYKLKDYEGSANAYKSSAMVNLLWICRFKTNFALPFSRPYTSYLCVSPVLFL